MRAAVSLPAVEERPPWALAWWLSLGQIVSWGSLYYAFSVLVEPIHVETGWSRVTLNAGLSLGLLTAGLCAVPVGRIIQRHGGRGTMAAGSLLAGIALLAMAVSSYPIIYYSAWLLLGAAMAAVLYEPAFAVVTGSFGSNYRRGITLITLVGGFASTVFLPLTQLAVNEWGWRDTLLLFAALQWLVGAPLHWFALSAMSNPSAPARVGETPARKHGQRDRSVLDDPRDPRLLGLMLWFTAHAAAFSGLIFQLIPLLQSQHVATATILQALVLIGPMQVAGRIVLGFAGPRFDSLRLGRLVTLALALALLVLLLLPPTALWLAVFAALFGFGNGIMTILRGTAVAEVFGRTRYAELNGVLALPTTLAKAASPLLLAAIGSVTPSSAIVFVAVLLLLAVGAFGLRLASQPASKPPCIRTS